MHFLGSTYRALTQPSCACRVVEQHSRRHGRRNTDAANKWAAGFTRQEAAGRQGRSPSTETAPARGRRKKQVCRQSMSLDVLLRRLAENPGMDCYRTGMFCYQKGWCDALTP